MAHRLEEGKAVCRYVSLLETLGDLLGVQIYVNSVSTFILNSTYYGQNQEWCEAMNCQAQNNIPDNRIWDISVYTRVSEG